MKKQEFNSTKQFGQNGVYSAKKMTYREERIVAIQQSNLRQGRTKDLKKRDGEVSDLEGRSKRITDREQED